MIDRKMTVGTGPPPGAVQPEASVRRSGRHMLRFLDLIEESDMDLVNTCATRTRTVSGIDMFLIK